MEGYDLFLTQFDAAIQEYPKLSRVLNSEGQQHILAGELDIVDTNGKFWDTFSIEIHCSKEFPKRFPRVYEVGGKIPKIADWHINEGDETCCIKALPEELIRCQQGITLCEFIDTEVKPYFFNQCHRRVEGFYVNGEYSHGLLGVFESYARMLGTENDLRNTLQLMILIASIEKPGRTHTCFCGSGQKYRKCHREAYGRLSLIKQEMLIHVEEIAAASKEPIFITFINQARETLLLLESREMSRQLSIT